VSPLGKQHAMREEKICSENHDNLRTLQER
jgi:hypothetical protein